MIFDPLKLPKPKEPYRGILPFRLLDWRIFFEREAEIERLTNLVSLYRGVLLYGLSGTGKSSLLNAGLMAYAMRRGRAPERIRVYPQKGKELFVEPISLREGDFDVASQTQSGYLPSRFIPPGNTPERVQLSCAEFLKVLKIPSESLGPPLLIFDQFEELATLFEENPRGPEQIEEARGAQTEIQRLVCELLLNTSLPVKVVFAFRDDYLARLIPLFSRIPHLFDQAVRLERPKIELLQRIIRGPFLVSQERGISAGDFAPELSEELAQKIESGVRTNQPSGRLNLSEVQTLCLALWKQPKLQEELLRPGADTPAILRRIIESEAMATLNQLRLWDRVRAIAVLSNLVTEDGTRNVVPQQMLVTQTRRNPVLWLFRGKWQKFLNERLPNTGLVRRSLSSGSHYYYELASESLIPRIQKWQQKLRRRRQLILVCICVLLVGFPSYEWYRAKKATQAAKAARKKAAATKDDADKMLSFLQYDLSDTFRKLGQPDMMKEINVLIRQHFAEFPPEADDLDAIRAQAVATMQHGDLLKADGRLEGIADEYSTALKIFLHLGALRPNDRDYQRDISLAYERVADALSAEGDVASGLKNCRSSLAVAERLAKANPEDDDLQRVLLVSQQKIGNLLRQQGDLGGALQQYRDGFAIAAKLGEADPEDANRQRDLLVCYQKVASVLRDQGDLTGALQDYRKSVAIAEKLAKADAGNSERQDDLCFSYCKVGDLRRSQGDLTEALKSYQAGLAIAEKLADQDPHNTGWQLSLASVYAGLGSVQRDQKDFVAALENYGRCQSTMEALVEYEPTHVDWKRNLASTYEGIGNVLHDEGDHAEALKSFNGGLAITKELLQQNPNNFSWQSDLSDWYANIGKVLRQQGDFAGALKSYQNSLALREGLASRDRSNAFSQGDLGWILWQTGMVLEKVEPASKGSAFEMVKKGHEILRQLKARASLTVEREQWLREIEADVNKMGR